MSHPESANQQVKQIEGDALNATRDQGDTKAARSLLQDCTMLDKDNQATYKAVMKEISTNNAGALSGANQLPEVDITANPSANHHRHDSIDAQFNVEGTPGQQGDVREARAVGRTQTVREQETVDGPQYGNPFPSNWNSGWQTIINHGEATGNTQLGPPTDQGVEQKAKNFIRGF